MKPEKKDPETAQNKEDTPQQSSEPIAEDSSQSAESAAEQSQSTEEEPVDAADDLKQQLDAMSDRYLRLMAEFDNFKKRVSRDYERLVESANEKLMQEMIEVRENFERAIRSGEKTTDAQSLLEGMKLIYSKFNDILGKNGLESFAQIGDVFDPQIHDALMKQPSDTVAEDHLADVFERGYRLKNRVIKHARVIVSGGKPASTDKPEQD